MILFFFHHSRNSLFFFLKETRLIFETFSITTPPNIYISFFRRRITSIKLIIFPRKIRARFTKDRNWSASVEKEYSSLTAHFQFLPCCNYRGTGRTEQKRIITRHTFSQSVLLLSLSPPPPPSPYSLCLGFFVRIVGFFLR